MKDKELIGKKIQEMGIIYISPGGSERDILKCLRVIEEHNKEWPVEKLLEIAKLQNPEDNNN